jgi:phosphatidylserine decarboxylase
MKNSLDIRYVDRKSRRLVREKVYASGFLYWSYNNGAGRWLTDKFFTLKPVSQLYGFLNSSGLSRNRIKPFARSVGIDPASLEPKPDAYSSFNDFFMRPLAAGDHEFDGRPDRCLSPVDGRILVYESVSRDQVFSIKRNRFTLEGMLNDRGLADSFDGGAIAICRVGLADYHGFHFPDSGVAGRARSVEGRYYAGGGYALSSMTPFYTENRRDITLLESDRFGSMAIVEIGAFTVGSIRQRYQPGQCVERGTVKGFFELGGSTVVLVFLPGAIEFDFDLLRYSASGLETNIKVGESIGRNAAATQYAEAM